MLQTRVIPCLLLRDGALVKTVRFKNGRYIGDPVNTVRIFNELEVDELIVLDIRATIEGREPDFSLLAEIADECFMPLAYGGGVSSLLDAERIFKIGVEKVIINTSAVRAPQLIGQIAEVFGSQSLIVSIDVKRTWRGREVVHTHGGTVKTGKDPVAWAIEVQSLGAGEIMLTDIDREGTWRGIDTKLIRSVAEAVSVPLIAHGGCASIADIEAAVKIGHASAVGVGSMVVYQGKGMGVLVNFPDQSRLRETLKGHEHG
ncbi:imidazole glycerol phosphate synthase subunit HisF [Bordetella genomosp. 7]|uniref:AglZ/HisF2 family acetamidino modification protein n=1 Tax=Bordetella genomosp. 7 TaxID=1416805 RepID=UPI000B9DEB2D|nr:AglZ/HisF2 family acetamidino modification protein [Bordetella genomosp. 7]OZI15795.1 imidazole glycerol phosphate synthase subunit HisF [Bordetella genomosp. 7]